MKNHLTLTINFVKEKLEGAEAGHDWFHIERVWKLSKKIAEKEGGNLEVIELSALLHDIADPKFHNGDETLALKISKDFLEEIQVDAELIEQVLFVIKNISFKKGNKFLIVAPSGSGKSTLAIEASDLKAIKSLDFAVEVEQLKSGKSGMDDNTFKALKSKTYKNIK